MRVLMLSLLSFILALALCAHAATYDLYHRLQVPGSPEVPFVKRGTLDVAENHVSASTDLALWLEKRSSTSGALYQLALNTHATAVSSVKLCHLASATSQTLYLYLSEDDIPYGLNYIVSPVPHDGSCPTSTTPFHLNTTILLRKPSSPPSPELKTPPPLTPEGQVVQPVPEKSFLAKYWIYISIFLVGIMLTGGPPEEAGGSQ